MVKATSFHHRATLKQSNKAFKSKFASKGAVKDRAKGKVSKVKVAPTRVKGVLTKSDRKNAAKMVQLRKRGELEAVNQIFEGKHGANKIVALVPLTPDSSSLQVAQHLFSAVNQPFPENTVTPVLNCSSLKHKVQLVCLERNLFSILDACKVADFVIFILSAEVEVDSFGELCIASAQSQGIPNSFNLVTNCAKLPAKRQVEVKRSLSSFISYFFPENNKIVSGEDQQECSSVLRSIVSQAPKKLAWRDHHPYILAEQVDYVVNPETKETGTLLVRGFVRGAPMSANRLVHLQNLGDFQVLKIEKVPAPGVVVHEKTNLSLNFEPLVDVPDPELQDSLVSENVPDSMEGEQTWPTEEEMLEADERIQSMGLDNEANRTTKTKKVVKGTSAYQAAWIVESDEEDDGSEASADGMGDSEHSDQSDHEEYENVELESEMMSVAPETDLQDEDHLQQYEEYLKSRKEEFEGFREFPDEVDTPRDIPARVRFQRYRGLLSMRTSPWDPYENLPVDYSRIFQFQNFTRTRRRVIEQLDSAPIKVGTYVTIHIANVPRSIEQLYSVSRPFVVFGLLQHENKATVVNYTVLRTTEYKDPIKSKDPLIIQTGFRRYRIHPIFSQNAKKAKNSNGVYKLERFLPHSESSVMTFYGPTTFSTTPALIFKESSANSQELSLVALGTFKDTDPTRIIAKRIVLSGHPFKVNKRSAVVRYMFFNPADINWFKPIQLRTKFGRVGHIRDTIGTHGYMKCIFDGPMKQHDTVLLSLYKRIFPKWNTQLFVDLPQPTQPDPEGDRMV